MNAKSAKRSLLRRKNGNAMLSKRKKHRKRQPRPIKIKTMNLRINRRMLHKKNPNKLQNWTSRVLVRSVMATKMNSRKKINRKPIPIQREHPAWRNLKIRIHQGQSKQIKPKQALLTQKRIDTQKLPDRASV